jgi:predicted AAA+ superfamily ATPase
LTVSKITRPLSAFSPLSVNAIREDLQVSHKAVSRWLEILERLYALFRLAPFGAPQIRAVKKEQKHYHFDWTLISNEALRFENLVACALLKWVNFQEDTQGEEIELRYFRDVDGREVDFVVTKDQGLFYLSSVNGMMPIFHPDSNI